MKPTLSILICSLTSRNQLLNGLVGELIKQCENLGLLLAEESNSFGSGKVRFRELFYGSVEIRIATDNKSVTTGAKRNMLVKRARGIYIVFIDDDDMVPSHYIAEILKAARHNADCMAINGIMTTNGKDLKKWFINKDYGVWRTVGNVFERTPNHISPIRGELVKQVPFPDKSSGEDSDFSERILPLLKTQTFIVRPMYMYQFSTQKK